jgi:hypothetical protein
LRTILTLKHIRGDLKIFVRTKFYINSGQYH